MAIPTYKQMKKPILECATQHNQPIHKTDFYDYLFTYFQATEEEKVRSYDSGNGLVFTNRVAWALSELFKEGLLGRSQRGHYFITDSGRSFLVENKEESHVSPQVEEDDPTAKLYSSFKVIRQEIYDEILEMILKKNPYEFEKIVLQLMQKMGYGGSIEDSGEVTQKSRDGGIDVEIKEDVLGLGRIHVQVKRYKRESTIGEPNIREFAGSLRGKLGKGVFITTAKFTKDAILFAQNYSDARIVLIDGEQLAKYIYQYDLGMQTEQTIQIKRLDSDYWDSFINEKRNND